MENPFEKEDMSEVSAGMWLAGREQSGHYVMGYIERVDGRDMTALVRVLHACCEQLKGKQVWVLLNNEADILNEAKYSDVEGYLMNAIDLALDMRDEAWFKELTKQLQELKNPEPPKYGLTTMFRIG